MSEKTRRNPTPYSVSIGSAVFVVLAAAPALYFNDRAGALFWLVVAGVAAACYHLGTVGGGWREGARVRRAVEGALSALDGVGEVRCPQCHAAGTVRLETGALTTECSARPGDDPGGRIPPAFAVTVPDAWWGECSACGTRHFTFDVALAVRAARAEKVREFLSRTE